MGHIDSRENDLAVDLESGGTTSEEDGSTELCSGGKSANRLLGRAWSGFVSLDGSMRGGDGLSSCNNVSSSGEISAENFGILSDKLREESVSFMEKKIMKEKRKNTSSKKPPKPPRPPRGLSLDAADLKLVGEISKLAMLKHARIERMKALKKRKAGKASSSNTNLFAMVITILFFLMIIFKGFLGSRV